MGNCFSSIVQHAQEQQTVDITTATPSSAAACQPARSRQPPCCTDTGHHEQQGQQQLGQETSAAPAGAAGPQPQLPRAELECLLDCICQSLNTPFSLVYLIHSDNQCWFYKSVSTLQISSTLDSASGSGCSCALSPALHSAMCKWSSSCNGNAVSSPQTIVCSDVAAGHEADCLPWKQLGLASYAAAPMMAANGQALGWLVVGDVAPKRMDAGMCRVLNNLAEISVRILERHVLLVHRLDAARLHVPRQLRQLWQAAAAVSYHPSASLVSSSRAQNTQQPCDIHSELGAGLCVCTAASMAWEDDDMAFFPELQAAALQNAGGLVAASHVIPPRPSAAASHCEGSFLTDDLWKAPAQPHLYGPGKQHIMAEGSNAGFLYGAGSMQDKVSETWAMAGATASWPVVSEAATTSMAAPEQALMMNAFTRLLRSQHQALQACVLIVDTSKPGWPVMYADKTWRCWAGYSRNHILGKSLMSLVMPASEGCAAPRWELLARKAQAGKRFILPGMCACGLDALGDSDEKALPSEQPQTQPLVGCGDGVPSMDVLDTAVAIGPAELRPSLDAVITIQDAPVAAASSLQTTRECTADATHVNDDARTAVFSNCLELSTMQNASERDVAALALQQSCASDLHLDTVNTSCTGVASIDKSYQRISSWGFQDLQKSEPSATTAAPAASSVRTLIDAVHPHPSHATWHGLDLLMPEEPHHVMWGVSPENLFSGFSVKSHQAGAGGAGMTTTRDLPSIAAADQCSASGYISEKTSVLLARVAQLEAAAAAKCPSSQLCPLPSAPPLLGSTTTGSSIVLPACPLSTVSQHALPSQPSQMSAGASSGQPGISSIVTGKLDTSRLSLTPRSSTGVGSGLGSSMRLDSGVPRRMQPVRGCLGHHFDLSFRPIAMDLLDRDTLPSGIPSHTAMTVDASVAGLYAVRLHQQGLLPTPPDHLTPNGKLLWGGGSSLPTRLAAEVFPDLQLDHLLGRGGYGVAFHGLWHDAEVVLKLQDLDGASTRAVAHAQLEVYLGQQMGHPNVVRTLTHATLEMPAQAQTGPDLPARTNRRKHALAAACAPAPAADTCLCDNPMLQGLRAMAVPGYTAQQHLVQQPLARQPSSPAGIISEPPHPQQQRVPAPCAPQECAHAAWPPAPETLASHNQQGSPTDVNSTDVNSCVLSLAPEQASVSRSGCHAVATGGPYAHRIAEMDSFCGFDLQRRPCHDQSQPRAQSPSGQPSAASKSSHDSPNSTPSSGVSTPAVALQASTPITERSGPSHLPPVAEEMPTPNTSQYLWQDGLEQLLSAPGTGSRMDAVRRPVDQANKWKATALWLDDGQGQAGPSLQAGTQQPITSTATPHLIAGKNPLQALHVTQPARLNPAGWPGVEVASNQGTWQCKLLQPPPSAGKAQAANSMLVTMGGKATTGMSVDSKQSDPMQLSKAADGGTLQEVSCPPCRVRLLTIHEFCDGGSLQNIIDRGWFRHGSTDKTSPIDMSKVLSVSCDIASGLAFLHSCGVIHADLSASNVLLCTQPTQDASDRQHMLTSRPQLFPYCTYQSSSMHDANRAYLATKYIAKIADFGKAAICTGEGGEEELISVDNYATVTFMAPEVLRRKEVSRQADIYSLGVLLWQMLTGQNPWPGSTHQQVVDLVVNQSAQLTWPDVHVTGPFLQQSNSSHARSDGHACQQGRVGSAMAVQQPASSNALMADTAQQRHHGSAQQQPCTSPQQWGTQEQVEGLIQLGRACLHPDRLQRPSAAQVVEQLQRLMHGNCCGDPSSQGMHDQWRQAENTTPSSLSTSETPKTSDLPARCFPCQQASA